MAKRFYDLYPQLTSFANLHLAYRQAAKGKRGQPEVAAFEYSLENNLFTLQAELQDQSYRPGAYRSFYIRDPKRRLISAAPFRDRVVHHALCNLIEPLFERTFIGDSYANRVGKGTHAALDRTQQFARRYCFCLQCDVRQFFPSVDHAVLAGILARKIGDAQALWLCGQKCSWHGRRSRKTSRWLVKDSIIGVRKGCKMQRGPLGPGENRRVVRGGSWNNNQRNARCGYRNRNIPTNFNNNLGFRVVLSIAF